MLCVGQGGACARVAIVGDGVLLYFPWAWCALRGLVWSCVHDQSVAVCLLPFPRPCCVRQSEFEREFGRISTHPRVKSLFCLTDGNPPPVVVHGRDIVTHVAKMLREVSDKSTRVKGRRIFPPVQAEEVMEGAMRLLAETLGVPLAKLGFKPVHKPQYLLPLIDKAASTDLMLHEQGMAQVDR